MRAGLVIAATAALLTACAGSPTHKHWSCSPAKGSLRSCASIGEIDARSQPQPSSSAGAVTLRALSGAAPAAAGAAAAGAVAPPVREGETVLRIIVAPWVDAAGDYHARSDIYAVVRRGGWTVPVPPPPPPPVKAETAS